MWTAERKNRTATPQNVIMVEVWRTTKPVETPPVSIPACPSTRVQSPAGAQAPVITHRREPVHEAVVPPKQYPLPEPVRERASSQRPYFGEQPSAGIRGSSYESSFPSPSLPRETAVSPPASQGPERISGDPIRSYYAALRAAIEARKEYPLLARRRKLEGTVVLLVTLLRNGRLIAASVIHSSNESMLDNAALRAINSVTVFPEAPPEIQKNEIAVEVPVVFRIREN